MLRPAEFSVRYRTINVVPYQMIASPVETPERGSSNGGVFHRGQIVWTQRDPSGERSSANAVGFVDGLGHVLIDRRVLRLVEALPSSQN